jgi:8-amino-7-oxononanoate synthase
MPVHEDGDWHDVPITHIVPLWVNKQKYAMYLAFHLTRDGFNGCHIVFPIVGKGEDRVRLIMHAHNTEDDVKRLVDSICTWAQEMMDIEAGPDKKKLPSSARLAYDLVEKDRQSVDEPNGMNGANGHNGSNGINESTLATVGASVTQGIANGSNGLSGITHRTKGIAV